MTRWLTSRRFEFLKACLLCSYSAAIATRLNAILCDVIHILHHLGLAGFLCDIEVLRALDGLTTSLKRRTHVLLHVLVDGRTSGKLVVMRD